MDARTKRPVTLCRDQNRHDSKENDCRLTFLPAHPQKSPMDRGTLTGMDASSLTPGGADSRVLQSRVICILWHAPGGSVDADLERGLKRWQGLVVTECHSAPAAIAEVMSIERAMRAGKREPTVLLLVDPEKLIGAPDVLHTMDKYSPTTRCWCYEPGSTEMLRAVTPKDIANWTRKSLERQKISNPETAPRVNIVPGVTLSRPVATPSPRPHQVVELPVFQPPSDTEIKLAQTLLEQSPPTETRSYVDPDDPKLHFETEPERPPIVPNWKKDPAEWSSDNKLDTSAKWGGGISNVLTPDEMAMLLADDDGRAHT